MLFLFCFLLVSPKSHCSVVLPGKEAVLRHLPDTGCALRQLNLLFIFFGICLVHFA